MKLYIDTTKIRSATVALGNFKKTSDSLLLLIEEALEHERLVLTDITEIEVATGPGSFTGLRVGIAVVNMLGSLLKILINGLPVGTMATPVYTPSKFDV